MANTPTQTLAAAMAAHRAGDLKAAGALYRQILHREPDNAEALSLLGVVHFQSRQHDDAIRLIRKAIHHNPGKADYYANLGLALRESERFEEALEAAAKAVELRPEFAEAHANHGLALMALRRPEDAIASFRRAIALKPDVAGFHNSLGNACRGATRYAEAEVAYRAALALNPNHTHAMFGLAYSLDELERVDEALTVLERLVTIDPAFAEAHLRIGIIYSRRGLIREAIDSMNRAGDADPEDIRARGGRVFISNFLEEVTASDMLDLAAAFAGMLAERTPRKPLDIAPDPDRVLRLGLVSADLHDLHPVGAFTKGLLENIDRSQFQLHAYNTGRKEGFKPLFDVWRDVDGLRPATIADLIRKDDIDILLDLAGYTDGARPDTFAAAPAPIQVIWLGYSGTSGSPLVDHIIADSWVIPPGEERYYSEKPLRLPDSYLCWTPPQVHVPVTPPLAGDIGTVTFGSFNNIRKVGSATARTWASVLDAVPGSRLVLKHAYRPDPSVVRQIRDIFEAQGVDSGRIEFLDPLPQRSDHLAAYGRIDIGLDPFPYNGTTTTMEALWMGVPVLTLAGNRFIARVGESILNTLGMPDWIAADTDDYVAKAAAFASDIPRLAAIRAGLRQRLVASPLCDASRFAANFQAALRDVWRAWCARQPVRSSR